MPNASPFSGKKDLDGLGRIILENLRKESAALPEDAQEQRDYVVGMVQSVFSAAYGKTIEDFLAQVRQKKKRTGLEKSLFSTSLLEHYTETSSPLSSFNEIGHFPGNVIAFASGKGGTGKSTTSLNEMYQLARYSHQFRENYAEAYAALVNPSGVSRNPIAEKMLLTPGQAEFLKEQNKFIYVDADLNGPNGFNMTFGLLEVSKHGEIVSYFGHPASIISVLAGDRLDLAELVMDPSKNPDRRSLLVTQKYYETIKRAVQDGYLNRFVLPSLTANHALSHWYPDSSLTAEDLCIGTAQPNFFLVNAKNDEPQHVLAKVPRDYIKKSFEELIDLGKGYVIGFDLGPGADHNNAGGAINSWLFSRSLKVLVTEANNPSATAEALEYLENSIVSSLEDTIAKLERAFDSSQDMQSRSRMGAILSDKKKWQSLAEPENWQLFRNMAYQGLARNNRINQSVETRYGPVSREDVARLREIHDGLVALTSQPAHINLAKVRSYDDIFDPAVKDVESALHYLNSTFYANDYRPVISALVDFKQRQGGKEYKIAYSDYQKLADMWKNAKSTPGFLNYDWGNANLSPEARDWAKDVFSNVLSTYSGRAGMSNSAKRILKIPHDMHESVLIASNKVIPGQENEAGSLYSIDVDRSEREIGLTLEDSQFFPIIENTTIADMARTAGVPILALETYSRLTNQYGSTGKITRVLSKVPHAEGWASDLMDPNAKLGLGLNHLAKQIAGVMLQHSQSMNTYASSREA